MLNLTRQEKQVLLFVGAVVLAGIIINYLQKINPGFKVILPQGRGGSPTAPTSRLRGMSTFYEYTKLRALSKYSFSNPF